MKFAPILFTAAAAATISVAPAHAGGWWGGRSGGHSSSGGHGSSGGATPVPEPSDAILLLMGAAGVVIGRKLHARAKRRD